MTPITLAELATVVAGDLVGDGDAVIRSVSTDSRTVAAGELFVALIGDTHDGHDKLDEVAAKGSAAAIVSSLAPPPPGEAGWGRRAFDGATEPIDAARPHLTSPGGGGTGLAWIKVADTRKALGLLARHARRQLKNTRVIAIAGSNGKTTTKNLLHAVLWTMLKGTASPRSFNNDIGVPATLLPVDPADAYVIVEVGTNHPGEIESLSLIAEPDCAVIVSIGEEHLEFFKDLDGVRRENGRIVAGLRAGGPLIVTGDDAALARLLPGDRAITTFGFDAGNTLRATDVHISATGTQFCFEERMWNIPLIGAHFAACGLAAIACARWMGLSDDDIQLGFDRAQPSDMRMQPKQIGSITLLNDAYNANPTSMRAALQTAHQIAPPRRLVLILGDMGELGDVADAAHREIAAEAKKLDALLVTVGRAFEPHRGEHWFLNAPDVASAVRSLLLPGDVVLLKGSRFMKLETVAAAIEEAFA